MKLLLPTDGSDYSEGAARFLTQLSFTPDDEITVLHVISWVPFQDDVQSYHSSLKRIKQDIAPKILDSTVDILKPLPARISVESMEGYPDKSIIEAAETSGTDLIVMGARGLKGIKQLILGSVTRSVAINSPKSLLVIKPPQFSPSSKLNIIFATDGSDHANAAEALLTSLPFSRDSEMNVLNVVWSAIADIPDRLSLEIRDEIKEEVAMTRSIEFGESEKILEPVVKNLRKRFSKVNGLTRAGDPSIEILSLAEELKADIIFAGCRGLKGVKGMLGSVSRNVLRHSRCSVLIGKA
ncbi:putative Universal stress protein UspA-like protein [Candidatus Sulfobium mesophilum]|uniref:Putative Universal stress protein UspA-like protein n=1 Tax=Candidatus Sulfobium mesophilum TaxID=2016548 RepID=A0A2U3QIE7_9BACT|nr:putative Universal stress protein UspA-like protein [Candidatus Sulfobium mesophilum]